MTWVIELAKTIKADVPLSEMFGYVTTLRTFHLEQHLLWHITRKLLLIFQKQ
jgi:hypothetical protein